MGFNLTVSCLSCTYQKQFKLGSGRDYHPDAVITYRRAYYGCKGEPVYLASSQLGLITSESALGQIGQLMGDKQGRLDPVYGYQVYYCSRCHQLHNRFFLRVHHREGIYEPEYRCYPCRVRLKVVDYAALPPAPAPAAIPLALDRHPCPQCGQLTLAEIVECREEWG